MNSVQLFLSDESSSASEELGSSEENGDLSDTFMTIIDDDTHKKSTGVDRKNSSTASEEEIKPLLGEVSIDGSLLVLVPAFVIATLGVATTIMIAVEATDPVLRTEPNAFDGLGGDDYQEEGTMKKSCKGICSSQEDDIDRLRAFLDTWNEKEI